MKNNLENFDNQQENKPAQFKKCLIESDVSDGERLKEFENNPDMIIRKEPLWEFKKKFKDIENPIEAIKICKRLFDELKNEYEINMPDLQFVIGKDEKNEPCLYAFTSRITGKNIEDFSGELLDELSKKEGEKFIEELNKLYFNLASYIQDKYQHGERFLNDIFINRQYVYGRKKGEKQNYIYLVDTDTYTSEDNKEMLYDIWKLNDEMIWMEQQFDGIEFKKARNKLQNFVKSVSRESLCGNDAAIKWFEQTRKDLNIKN